MQLSGEFAALLILVFMPIDLLFRVPGRALYLSGWEIVRDAGLLVLFAAVTAVIASGASTVVAVLLRPISRRASDYWLALVRLSAAALTLLLVLPIAKAWWALTKAQWGIGGLGPAKYVLALAVLAALAWQWRRRGLIGISDTLSRALSGGRTALLLCIAAAFAVTVPTGHLSWRGFGWQAPPPVLATGAADGRNHVIVILIDTLTARAMSTYGNARPTTPSLDRLAKRSFVFDNFYASSNYTTSSVVSMITGRHLTSHRVFQLDGYVGEQDRATTLPAIMKTAGYTTGAVISNPYAHPLSQRTHDSYDYYSEMLLHLPMDWAYSTPMLHRARLLPEFRDALTWPLTMRMVEWLDDEALQLRTPFPPEEVRQTALRFVEEAHAPYFLWAHFLPPHDPYLPAPQYKGRFLEGPELVSWKQQHATAGYQGSYGAEHQGNVDRLRLRYEENLAYVDAEMGELLDALERRGDLDRSILVVASDHGESFSHGWQGHNGVQLFNDVLHVPLIIHLPGQTEGRRIENYASHVDLLPTLAELAGVTVPAGIDGRSLAPLLRGGTVDDRPLFAMWLESTSRFRAPHKGTMAVIEPPYKLIRYLDRDCEQLFDLEADPGETTSLSARMPDVADRLREKLADAAGVELQAPPDRSAVCTRLEFVTVAGK